jgi:predicted amidohydrolase
MKALLAQLACRIGDIEGNAARAVDAIRSHPERALTAPATRL